MNKIARVTTTGDVTQYQHGISAGAGPQEITVGPDGNLWFTESGQTGGKPGIAKAVVKGLPDVPVPSALTRLYGADRFGTANAIADSEYPGVESAQGVVLARADDFPDALAGSALAVKLNAPLLLTQSGTLGYTADRNRTSAVPWQDSHRAWWHRRDQQATSPGSQLRRLLRAATFWASTGMRRQPR